MATNLLKNPDGSEKLKHWDLVANGGDGWKVEDMPESGPLHIDVPKFFATSFKPCMKKQVIKLLNHFTKEQLDSVPPVTVEDWYCCGKYCSCIYQITVRLLDKKHKVIGQFQPRKVTLEPTTAPSWIKVAYTFSGYGPGLRYVSFEDGGQATDSKRGQGVRVTASSVTIKV